jgi:hypothetical protein
LVRAAGVRATELSTRRRALDWNGQVECRDPIDCCNDIGGDGL